ncbi:hypothetical protein TrRE_jg171, partial [Triparma retinervis]
MRAVFD